MEDLILSKRHRKSPSFEFSGGVTLMLSGLVVGYISMFLLSLSAYFLWRTAVRQSLLSTLAGERREIRLP